MLSPPPSIEIKDLDLRYLDAPLPILNKLSMQIPAASWTAILGQSGCGKTTLLRYLAGLSAHHVQVEGQVSCSTTHSIASQIAYMAQQDLLLPWLTVLDNVCLSLRFCARPRPFFSRFSPTSLYEKYLAPRRRRGTQPPTSANDLAKAQAFQLLQQVGLSPYADAWPHQLSGGMRQRVALARTLMQHQPIVLMDEPFSALDAVTRHKLQSLAFQLLKNKTVILITHDPHEAIRLADKLYILQHGQAQAISLPITIAPRAFDPCCADLHQDILSRLSSPLEATPS